MSKAFFERIFFALAKLRKREENSFKKGLYCFYGYGIINLNNRSIFGLCGV
jgi:hypothetical protein